MSLRPSTLAVFLATVALLALVAWRTAVIGSAAADTKEVPAASNAPATASTPVLVELFTSEGCSSCPPADALLSRLGRTQPVRGADIIALEEHVEYWDHLGWKDPYSSEAATARQGEYGEAFGGRQVYTPQMIVDGRAEFVGSSDSAALRAIRTASQSPKPAVQLSWQNGDTLSIHVDALTNAKSGDSAQVFLAVAENMLHSDVKRGENAGRALDHNGVVRQLLPLGTLKVAQDGFSSAIPVHMDHEWNRANLRAVVFVQSQHTSQVFAVGMIPFYVSAIR
jgi:hypothetical protein